MSLYTRDSVEQVKDAVDMVELVGSRTDLRRVGSGWTGLCPFHDERTPSFSVNAEHKLYHCFGCGASGDAIRFVQETEGLDFREAIEALAERYRVELKREQEDPRAEKRRSRQERLRSLLDRATSYYARYLWQSQEAALARDYLAGRGLGEEVLREFRIGYAPSAWDRLLVAAQRDGFSVDELVAAGLAQRGRQGGYYDRFRSRIMFPLADPRGRVVGFGARAIRDEQRPKYLNTSENELFQKGNELFGMHLARGVATKAGRIVVAEGYTDVLALHQAGIRESVASMGTALTERQIQELSRAVRTGGTIFLALDADAAGQQAMSRTARSVESRDLELRVVEMPAGSDPADIVARDGSDAFAGLLERAISVPEFQVRRALSGADLGSARGRDRALAEVRPIIAGVPRNTATRDHLTRFVADKLDVPPEYLEDLTQRPVPVSTPGEGDAPAISAALDVRARAERIFLAMCIAQGDKGRDYLSALKQEHFSSDALRGVRDHLTANFEEPLANLPTDDPALAAQVMGVVALADEQPSSEAALRISFLQLERRHIESRLRQAEDTAPDRGVLSVQLQDIRRQMDEVMGQAS